jgi:hypothetical protein
VSRRLAGVMDARKGGVGQGVARFGTGANGAGWLRITERVIGSHALILVAAVEVIWPAVRVIARNVDVVVRVSS